MSEYSPQAEQSAYLLQKKSILRPVCRRVFKVFCLENKSLAKQANTQPLAL